MAADILLIVFLGWWWLYCSSSKDGESFSSKHCCSSVVVGHVNGLRSKCNRQYSDCHLHVCSTQAVNSKDTAVNSLCVKYKSS